MNVSWGDVNNVREPGDYPFRGGTLTVTVAEIAIWKNDPNVLFELMCKAPVEGSPVEDPSRYVLGKEVDEGRTPRAEHLFYTSSNGDSWSLVHDPATGAKVVLHRANAASGSHASHIEIETFLSGSANGPEHQALRKLFQASAQTATILIVYDIHPAQGAAYRELGETIKSLGAWWHHLETVWIVQCAETPDEIRNRLERFLGFDDQLLVIDISGDTATWAGVNDSGSSWLIENV
ncbi:hypothetical protein [Bradyrhizobium genosp. P]|uniref:hypothetical protein n=1 Tax=Bradyrhizobium genosp. P TaxID=83641 RepID=UPI003CF32680